MSDDPAFFTNGNERVGKGVEQACELVLVALGDLLIVLFELLLGDGM